MKKQGSLTSGFRKKRFYERKKQKNDGMSCEKNSIDLCASDSIVVDDVLTVDEAREYIETQQEQKEKNVSVEESNTDLDVPKTIAVLLDLDGTCDFIDDHKASVFISQLEFIRKKFGAEYGTISISTYGFDPSIMQEALDVLSRNLSDNIKIGTNFFYGGTYDYEKRRVTYKDDDFNLDKISTFDSYYIHNSKLNNQWFALIDDRFFEDTYKKYQKKHPAFVCRPSQAEKNLSDNNLMSFSTLTIGFDGVIEGMDTYINSIRNLSAEQILETQQTMMRHLSSHELASIIRSRDYAFLERYFMEGYADEFDYRDTLNWIGITNSDKVPTKEEMVHLNNIFEVLSSKFEVNKEENHIKKVKELIMNFEPVE